MKVRQTTSGRVGRDVGDCAIRSLVNATLQPYTRVRNLLRRHGMRFDTGFPLPSFLDEYDVFGYSANKKNFVGRGYSGGWTVEKFARYYPKGVWVLNLKHHVVCIRNGVVYDDRPADQLANSKVYTAHRLTPIRGH